MTFSANDPALPLILPDTTLDRRIHSPASSLVDYVNHLFRSGYSPDTLFDDHADFYALDFYVAQINNGGHSQFIGNSKQHLASNMQRAQRAAHRIGLPDLAELVGRCADWCRSNPEDAARQDGFETRAEALDSLDKALYALKFTQTGLESYLAGLETSLAERLRFKLIPPPEAADLIRQFADKTIALRKDLMPEAATLQASEVLNPLIERDTTIDYGAAPSERRDKAMARNREKLTMFLDKHFPDKPDAELREELVNRATRSFACPGLNERSCYHIASYVWIAQHPNLRLVPPETLTVEWDRIAADSSFATAENAARALNSLHAAIPSDEKLALSAAMGQLRRADGTGPLAVHVLRSFQSNTETHQCHVLKTTEGELFLEMKKGMVTLSELVESTRHKAYSRAYALGRSFGMVTAAQQLSLYQKVPKDAPGRQLGRARIDPAIRRLMLDLHLPEALALFTEDKERHIFFARGALDHIDIGAGALTWRFKLREMQVTFEADDSGVSLRTQTNEKHYPAKMLDAYRAERTRA